MKIAQIVYEKIHLIFESSETVEELYAYKYCRNDIGLVDITDVSPTPEEGWIYINDTFTKPLENIQPPTVCLEKAKTAKLSQVYTAFAKDKTAVVYTEQYGYDADPGSLLDFRNAKDRARDLRDAWVEAGCAGDEPTVPYRVYTRNGKAFIPHTHADFAAAQEAGAVQQIAAFTRFDELRAMLQAAQTVGEVAAISW